MSTTRVSIKIILWLMGIIIGLVATLPAVSYFAIGYSRMAGSLRAEGEIHAASVSRIINLNPEMWEYQDYRIREILSNRRKGSQGYFQRVLNSKSEIVLEIGEEAKPPVLRNSVDLLDFGVAAGRIESETSLRPLLQRSFMILTVMWMAGAVVLIWMRRTVVRIFLQAERKLRVSERKYRSLYNDALDMIHIVDTEGNIIDANRVELQKLGYRRKELLGKQLISITHPDFRQATKNALGRVLKGGENIYHYQTALVTKKGSKISVEVNAVPQVKDGKVVAARAIIRDVTDRERAQEELLRHQRRLHILASKVTSAEERERRGLAAVLHDDIGQLLAMCKLNLESTGPGDGDARVRNAREARQLLEQAIARTRSLTWELSSPTLYDLGLIPALEELCSSLEEHHDITFTIESGSRTFPVAEDVLGILYRSTRELLYNVIKHSGASYAKVRLASADGMLQISVSDDGEGFETAAALTPEPTGGFGLFNIRERLSDVGGRLCIRSASGAGTHVTLIVPEEGGEVE